MVYNIYHCTCPGLRAGCLFLFLASLRPSFVRSLFSLSLQQHLCFGEWPQSPLPVCLPAGFFFPLFGVVRCGRRRYVFLGDRGCCCCAHLPRPLPPFCTAMSFRACPLPTVLSRAPSRFFPPLLKTSFVLTKQRPGPGPRGWGRERASFFFSCMCAQLLASTRGFFWWRGPEGRPISAWRGVRGGRSREGRGRQAQPVRQMVSMLCCMATYTNTFHRDRPGGGVWREWWGLPVGLSARLRQVEALGRHRLVHRERERERCRG